MTLTFISNYMNHHQMPFCDALYDALGADFHFLQTMPMEEERRAMGWDAGQLPSYCVPLYEKPDAEALFIDADIALVGWAEREDLVTRRMETGRPTVRVSERIYREGRWKMVSPRGLVHKYREHIRYRKAPLYLLTIGAFTAGDFRLLHAYPGKMYRFGYFPESSSFDEETLFARKQAHAVPEILWAGRFMELKHPEFPLLAARSLRAEGVDFHLTMVGDGDLRTQLEQFANEADIADAVTFTGFLSPAETRARMADADIFLFTSNRLEGWGAVVSEAMDAGAAVVASAEAGGPPVLIKDGVNGYLYRKNRSGEMEAALRPLVTDRSLRERIGRAALQTIRTNWNARHAAEEFLRFCGCLTENRPYNPPAEGPMSAEGASL